MLLAAHSADAFVAPAPRAGLWARPEPGAPAGACARAAGACARALPAARSRPSGAPRLRMQRQVTDALKEVKAAPAVAVGDAVALLTFAAIGRGNHGSSDGSVFLTAFPFLLAWFLCAPVLGAYRSAPSLQQAVTTALPARALSVPLGCLLRGLLQDRVRVVWVSAYARVRARWCLSLVARCRCAGSTLDV